MIETFERDKKIYIFKMLFLNVFSEFAYMILGGLKSYYIDGSPSVLRECMPYISNVRAEASTKGII